MANVTASIKADGRSIQKRVNAGDDLMEAVKAVVANLPADISGEATITMRYQESRKTNVASAEDIIAKLETLIGRIKAPMDCELSVSLCVQSTADITAMTATAWKNLTINKEIKILSINNPQAAQQVEP